MNPRSDRGKAARFGLKDKAEARRVQPLALRVRVPRDRPGVPDAKPQINWKRLRQLALTGPGKGEATADHG
jgi:hypothetical protein